MKALARGRRVSELETHAAALTLSMYGSTWNRIAPRFAQILQPFRPVLGITYAEKGRITLRGSETWSDKWHFVAVSETHLLVIPDDVRKPRRDLPRPVKAQLLHDVRYVGEPPLRGIRQLGKPAMVVRFADGSELSSIGFAPLAGLSLPEAVAAACAAHIASDITVPLYATNPVVLKCIYLGGHGLAAAEQEPLVVAMSETGISVGATPVPWSSLRGISVGGPGAFTTGGGWIGGGFGFTGAVQGALYAGALNALTTRHHVQTILRIVTDGLEATLVTSDQTPEKLDIQLSPVRSALTADTIGGSPGSWKMRPSASASRGAGTSPGNPSPRFCHLCGAGLHAGSAFCSACGGQVPR